MSRSVVVTGAGKGLGYHIAQTHLALGDTVFALEYRVTEQLKALKQNGAALTIAACDISSTPDVRQALAALCESKTGIDILYNVAGLYFPEDTVPLESTDIDRALTLYNVNALGALRVISALSPCLGQGSVILNVTSEAGSVGACTRISEYGYCMSKAAENMGSKIFSNQASGRGIRVFCVHPGWMKTDMGGAGALLSPTAITPAESAEALTRIACEPSRIPSDIMYLDYQGNPLCW